MELASYLAGERWSDRPACTHPLLAHLARLVNDLTDDDDRPRLAPLIPGVIGLTGTGARWSDELTLLAASRAIPVVSEQHQRALAVGILACERVRAGRGSAGLHPVSRRALEAAPLAAAWAREFVDVVRRAQPAAGVHPGETVMEIAVVGLAQACIADPAGEMRRLLADAITLGERLAQRESGTVPALAPEAWQDVCRPAALTAH